MIYIIVLISVFLNIYLTLKCVQLKRIIMLVNGKRTLKFLNKFSIR